MAEIHHEHVVRDVPDDAEIVRDEEIGEPQLGLKVGEQVEDLRLDRNVERRDGFVGDDELRRQHQRAGNRDALTLAAREHVRVAPVVLRPQAHLRHHLARSAGPLGRTEIRVDDERLFENRAHLLAWIERPVRVLEHELHGPAQALCLPGRRAHRVDAVERQRALGGLLDQRDHTGKGGLAAAGFADDGKRAAGLDGEGHASDRLQPARLLEQAAPHLVDALQVAGYDDRGAHDAASAPTG
jgi:hypothetical protein